MQIFFALWGLIFIGVFVMILKKGKNKGSYKADVSKYEVKKSLDDKILTDPSWKGSGFNIYN